MTPFVACFRTTTAKGLGLLALALPLAAHADHILGTRFVSLQSSRTQFGDEELEDQWGNVGSVDLSVNLPLRQHLDAVLEVGYSTADNSLFSTQYEATLFSGFAALVGFYEATDHVWPFVKVAVGLVDSELTVNDPSQMVHNAEEDTDFGIGADAGVEAEIGDRVLVRLALGYAYLDNEDAWDVSASLGYWLTKRWLIGAGVSYEPDDENDTATISILFGF